MIRTSSKQLCPRGLHDSGRQSSLDSGIGIAMGSQSSYSGSFSSCTSSLDTASQGGGEEFGSLLSLPPAAPPPPPPPLPPPLSVVIPEQRSVTPTSSSCSSRPGSRASTASSRHSEEYQAPSLFRQRYDIPRSLLHSLNLRDNPAQEGPSHLGKDRRSSGGGGPELGLSDSPTEPSLQWVRAQRQAIMQRSHSWGSERAPSMDGVGRCTPRPPLLSGCPVCGGSQVKDVSQTIEWTTWCQSVNLITPMIKEWLVSLLFYIWVDLSPVSDSI